jgi:hypothetical protein
MNSPNKFLLVREARGNHMKLIVFQERENKDREKGRGVIRPGVMVKRGIIDIRNVIPSIDVVPEEQIMIHIINR